MSENPTQCKNLVAWYEDKGNHQSLQFKECKGLVVSLGRLLNNDFGDAGKLKHCMTCRNVIFVKENE